MFKNNNILTHFILPTSIPNTLNPHCFTYTTSAIIKSIPDKHSLAFSCDHMRRSSSIASPHSSQLIYYVRFMRSAYSFHRVCFDAYPISYLFASHLSHYVLNVTVLILECLSKYWHHLSISLCSSMKKLLLYPFTFELAI